MVKIKGIFAVGIILLFLGLAFNPVTAQTTIQNDFTVNSIDNLSSVQLTENDLTTMEKFLPELVEKIKTATSYSQIIEIARGFVKEYGRHPILVLILNLMIKTINFQYKFGQFLAVRKNAFVISWGVTNKLLTYRSFGIHTIRPLTFWYYSGLSDRILDSRTIIIDPYPLGIKVITGRQIGYMTDFIGLYMHRSVMKANQVMIYFIGYVKIIRGYDLSPINN